MANPPPDHSNSAEVWGLWPVVRNATCPTCGGTGPDQIDAVGDYGGEPYEARCGDEWHDDQPASDEEERANA